MKISNCKNCPFSHQGEVYHTGAVSAFPSLLCTLSGGAVITDPATKPDYCKLPITIERPSA